MTKATKFLIKRLIIVINKVLRMSYYEARLILDYPLHT